MPCERKRTTASKYTVTTAAADALVQSHIAHTDIAFTSTVAHKPERPALVTLGIAAVPAHTSVGDCRLSRGGDRGSGRDGQRRHGHLNKKN